MVKKILKKLYIKILMLFILFSSLGTFGGVHIQNSDTIEQLDEGPKPAVSANLAAWIIIAGDRSDHDKLSYIRNGCDEVFLALQNRGFAASDIYYLDPAWTDTESPAQSSYRDADTTLANIQYAIETWAAGKVDATHGLGIYLFDHGGTGYMCIPGSPELDDDDLNDYLDNLETNTGVNRIIIVYEACHAGSFIDPVSKDNRIVVTATDITHNSHVNAGHDWAVFSESFWSSIIQCNTIGEAFEDAVVDVAALGYGGSQFPWIDDNHDETGSEVDSSGNLPNGGDGNDALNVWIGSGFNCWEILIFLRPIRWFVPILPFSIPVWVMVETDSVVESVIARVVPPNWVPPAGEPEDPKGVEGKKLVEDTGVQQTYLYDRDGDGNFTGNLDFPNDQDFWGDEGDYGVNFIAKTQKGTLAKIESSVVTVIPGGNPPTDTTLPSISITAPSPNAVLSGSVGVIAEGDDDQALDKIQIHVDGDLVEEEIMPPYLPYPQATFNLDSSAYSSGAHNISATAFDEAGNTRTTSISVSIAAPGIPGFSIPILIVGSIVGIISIIVAQFKHNPRKKLQKSRN